MSENQHIFACDTAASPRVMNSPANVGNHVLLNVSLALNQRSPDNIVAGVQYQDNDTVIGEQRVGAEHMPK